VSNSSIEKEIHFISFFIIIAYSCTALSAHGEGAKGVIVEDCIIYNRHRRRRRRS
jgi:hypothetical protein